MKGTKFLSSKAILGIVTALAVVVTVAGSFAAWDVLSDKGSATVTYRSPVTVTASTFTASIPKVATVSDLNETTGPTITTGDAKFVVSDNETGITTSNSQLKLDITVKEGESNLTSNFDFTVSKGEQPLGTVTSGSVTDSSITLGESGNSYVITATPKSTADSATLAGKTLTLEATATLIAKS
ncbi:hypothetical protein [Eubacterium barkeri]|uniref:SipW-cognate class signal peptide n=1 Tax=Eubacterium barkeri TaxID=1528 RepID=A0A1H3AI15_EUBBA|nr:hypothetical protein [Eubacterium barkeri]SDX29367.1 hypothetical protein SAMN04488579_10153 [Eubacterium barkeri]